MNQGSGLLSRPEAPTGADLAVHPHLLRQPPPRLGAGGHALLDESNLHTFKRILTRKEVRKLQHLLEILSKHLLERGFLLDNARYVMILKCWNVSNIL